eukprot:TRINITY_DN15760_c0_g1_i1.p1 TRINITY_DN15760_c0_g1~~TRINITY_DN15760_c0_g1_i1.p1  ORF type:complete len:526 (+),score=127.46 TRINITY_DN15760_c0_g1_i1:43-1578(+)
MVRYNGGRAAFAFFQDIAESITEITASFEELGASYGKNQEAYRAQSEADRKFAQDARAVLRLQAEEAAGSQQRPEPEKLKQPATETAERKELSSSGSSSASTAAADDVAGGSPRCLAEDAQHANAFEAGRGWESSSEMDATTLASLADDDAGQSASSSSKGTSTTLARTFQEWRKKAAQLQELRAPRSTKQRSLLTPEIPAKQPNPALVLCAGSAFLPRLAEEECVARWCLRAWHDFSKVDRRQEATLLQWLLERWALTQDSFLLHGAFQAWRSLAESDEHRSRPPAWARSLQEEMRRALADATSVAQSDRRPADSDRSASPPAAAAGAPAACWTCSPAILVTALTVCAMTLVVHVLLLTRAAPGRGGHEAGLFLDADGDGIRDSEDRCPMSAVAFQSTWQTDWDSDGCLDAGEDTDDDGDGVPDTLDLCPRTMPMHGAVDADGCQLTQRQLPLSQPQAEETFATKVGYMLLEVIVGMIFTAFLQVTGISAWCCRRIRNASPSGTDEDDAL